MVQKVTALALDTEDNTVVLMLWWDEDDIYIIYIYAFRVVIGRDKKNRAFPLAIVYVFRVLIGSPENFSANQSSTNQSMRSFWDNTTVLHRRLMQRVLE